MPERGPASARLNAHGQPSCGLVLGFDVGARRIGVAVGSAFTSPRSLDVIQHRSASVFDWSRLDRLFAQWQPTTLIVGDPLTLDGHDQPARVLAHRFAAALHRRYNRAVLCVDERLSSMDAARAFADGRAKGTRRRRDSQKLDALAAVVILERWLTDPSQGIALTPSPLSEPSS